MTHEAAYDTIGLTYTMTRRPDPRIARAIANALGDSSSIVNIGAGTGAYEPADRSVVAIEPSWQMIRQRPAGSAPATRAVAEALPFPSRTFDAALAVLTLHHWSDWRAGIAEIRRVAARAVVLAFDADALDHFWLTNTYFPGVIAIDRARSPSIADIADALGADHIEPVLIPHDCVDGFLAANWCRPEMYLDPTVRAGISSLALLDLREVDQGVERLAADLASGVWDQRFGHHRQLDTLDAGYRLIVANGQ